MTVETLLSTLDKVRSTGRGRWIACCPAHEDKRPSMAIRELDDGRVLVHCFGGCDTESILGASGLTFADLMPEKLDNYVKGERRPFPAVDVLRCIGFEALLTMVAARTVANGQKLAPADHARLLDGVARIQSGLSAAGVSL